MYGISLIFVHKPTFGCWDLASDRSSFYCLLEIQQLDTRVGTILLNSAEQSPEAKEPRGQGRFREIEPIPSRSACTRQSRAARLAR